MKLEIRFYACLTVATVLLFCGLYLPPVGDISKSVQTASALIMIIGALCVGLDIRGILQEVWHIIEANNERMRILANKENTGKISAEITK